LPLLQKNSYFLGIGWHLETLPFQRRLKVGDIMAHFQDCRPGKRWRERSRFSKNDLMQEAHRMARFVVSRPIALTSQRYFPTAQFFVHS
jgi:hypothetical protein